MNTAVMPQIIPLWSDTITGQENKLQREQESLIPSPRFNNLVKNMKVVRNVSLPTLTVSLPDSSVANGTAVIICPGGGFSSLPIEIEGNSVAQWLTTRGIAAFVLK